jgi:hypothetical protein
MHLGGKKFIQYRQGCRNNHNRATAGTLFAGERDSSKLCNLAGNSSIKK